MYLVFLVKHDKEEAYSIVDSHPTRSLLEMKLQEISGQTGFPVVARSHIPTLYEDREVRAYPQDRVKAEDTQSIKTVLDKILQGETEQ